MFNVEELATKPLQEPINPPPTQNIQPKDKTDSQWLQENGYKSIIPFMQSRNLKIPDDLFVAKNLVAQFREKEQREWEVQVAISGRGSGVEGKKSSEEDVRLAILWHERLGHVKYTVLRSLYQRVSEVPDLRFYVEDVPVCEECRARGVDDR